MNNGETPVTPGTALQANGSAVERPICNREDAEVTARLLAPHGTQGVDSSKDAGVAPSLSTNLIKAMAESVGKDLAAYVEVMYPEAIKAASSTFRLSLKNHVYNDIMHVSTLHTEAEIRAWLAANDEHRKKWLAAYRKMRRQDNRTVEGGERLEP